MGVADGFWFWLGKELAEFAMGALVVVIALAAFVLIEWRRDRGRRR